MDPDYAALSASDGAGEPVRATVQSPGRSIGSTTIPVQATTNWPAGTFIATTGTLLSSGKLDPTTVQVFYGTASGTDITITAFAAGYTDKGNEAGDVVVIKPTTEWANVVAEGILGTTQFPANFANFVEPGGGVWSAGSGLVGSGTAGFAWYQGARSSMAAVTSHTFIASKDTYIDYNPTSATWTYLPETNGAAEPAVSTGSVRIAKVVTGSSTISSITQSEYNAPVGPSNLSSGAITLGYAQITTNATNASASPAQVSGLTIPVTIPSGGRRIKITAFASLLFSTTTTARAEMTIWDGTVGSGTQLQLGAGWNNGGSNTTSGIAIAVVNPAPGAKTYNVGLAATAGTGTINATATTPAFILVEAI